MQRQRIYSRSPSSLANHVGTLIFLHGRGDTGAGWFGEWTNNLQSKKTGQLLGGIRIVSPTAPIRPVEYANGQRMPAWHDIINLSNLSKQELPGIDESLEFVHEMIREEMKLVPANKIIVAGFSQGAALSLYAGLQFPDTLGGIFVLSGYLPHAADFSQRITNGAKQTPVFMCHGTDDRSVSIKEADIALETIQQVHPNISLKKYSNLAHSQCDEEMADVQNFIHTVWLK